MATNDLYKQFIAFNENLALFRRRERILLAVSGGVDSIVLLDLFLRVQQEWNLMIAIAHINHGLRGRKSDEEEAYVRNQARSNRLPFYSCKTDVLSYAKSQHQSLEEAGRDIRFGFFSSLINRLQYTRLALGHQANDQAETILMNLARGSGLRGIGGIRPRREEVIHPLLFASREDIESYARERKLDYVTDASNDDRRFLRNRVRLDIVETLKAAIGPHVVSSICRSGDAAREADAYFRTVSEEVRDEITIKKSGHQIVLDLYKFLSYLKAVQKAILINIIEEMADCQGCIRSSEIIRILQLAERGKSGARVDLRNGVKVFKSRSSLAFIRKKVRIPEIIFPVGSSVRITNDVLLISELIQKKGKRIVFNDDPAVEYFDYDMLSYPLSLRSVRPGDWFIPLGMKRKKKLHDFFIDEGFPIYQRSMIPLLISGTNIVWIVGYRMDNRYKVGENTKRILKIEARPS